jgi:hypothetical protein
MYYTLKVTDVGRPWVKLFGRTWMCSNFIGRIMKRDIGKRVYLRGDILQVENDEQRDERLKEKPVPCDCTMQTYGVRHLGPCSPWDELPVDYCE